MAAIVVQPTTDGAGGTGQAVLWLLSSALCFALMGVCVKQVGQRLPLDEVVLARAVVSLLLTAALLRQAGIRPWGQRRGLLVWRGVVGTVALYCSYGALQRLPLGAATVLQYLHPTAGALLAWSWLGERAAGRVWLALLLGWLGVLVLAEPGRLLGGAASLPLAGLGLGLAGALLSAVAYVSVRALGRSEHPLVVVFYFPLMALPLTLPGVLHDPMLPTAGEAIWLVGVGLTTQLGQIGLTRGLMALPTARATTIGYVQVPIAALLGVLLFGEAISANLLAAALLVLGATLLSLGQGPKAKGTAGLSPPAGGR